MFSREQILYFDDNHLSLEGAPLVAAEIIEKHAKQQ